MNYEFPKIEHIDDVLPHIEGREEFVVAKREFGTVINYNVVMPDSFPPINVAGGSAKMREQRSLTNRMRRECRGLKFSPDGEISARPFHKFFNVGEREETQLRLIDLSRPHTIMEKLDGSMIHPMMVDGYIRWMTKMGITTVSMQAEEFIAKHIKYKDFAYWCIENQMTPIFEWTSPFNRIVVPYEEERLTLLAVRNNFTGEYKGLG